MEPKVYIFLANGCEEVEALTTVDILRRAEINVVMVSVTGTKDVTGSHQIHMVADACIEQVDVTDASLLVLPGGMPGSKNLAQHALLNQLLTQHYEAGKLLAAICAAPMVLGRLGLLKGKMATCYPGFEDELTGASCTGALVQEDGRIITGKGPAAAMEFALTLVSHLAGKRKADAIARGLLYDSL